MHFVSFVTKLFAICKVYDLGLPQIRTPLFDPNVMTISLRAFFVEGMFAVGKEFELGYLTVLTMCVVRESRERLGLIPRFHLHSCNGLNPDIRRGDYESDKD